MKRREFIAGLGAAAAWPLAAHAQQQSGKIARIGYLTFRTPNAADDAFFGGLRELGWVEALNIAVERRHPAGDAGKLKEFAVELVRSKPDLIVTAAAAATQAVKDANGSAPLVFLAAGDPVGQRFVESLSHPGGNLTGVSFDATPDITAKQVQLLTEAIPNISRIAVLWNSASPFLRSYWTVAQAAAPALRVALQPVEVQDSKQLERAFDAMIRDRAEALIVLSDSFATFNRSRLSELAASHRLPAIYGHSGYIEAGGLMSYGPSLADVYRRGASYVDKILKGTKPSELPVEQPTKFELVINLKAAKTLGLEISPTLLARADEVIE